MTIAPPKNPRRRGALRRAHAIEKGLRGGLQLGGALGGESWFIIANSPWIVYNQ